MEIDFVYDYKVTQRVQKQTVNLQENQAISARKIKEVFQKRRKKKVDANRMMSQQQHKSGSRTTHDACDRIVGK